MHHHICSLADHSHILQSAPRLCSCSHQGMLAHLLVIKKFILIDAYHTSLFGGGGGGGGIMKGIKVAGTGYTSIIHS